MNKGFSLLETVVSLFLIAVIIGVSSLSFLKRPPRYILRKAVWEVNSQMNLARYKSIFQQIKIKISFHESGYIIEKYDPDHKKWIKEKERDFKGVTISATNSPIFHPLGTVSNLASVTISNRAGQFKISLAISGRIKIVPL
ncbi:MAG: prepilin-type N-terminal cleavage/methylation domain-containing protein [Candidatus Aminicenantes bacterium]|nr:prepilin-type N-terminal cleavage/methylation domain-containing protein [Candidatus Aminicenantes bacterium]